eukprot:scaffold104659_cov69-Phaeocystis_antarctica.AAC.5
MASMEPLTVPIISLLSAKILSSRPRTGSSGAAHTSPSAHSCPLRAAAASVTFGPAAVLVSVTAIVARRESATGAGRRVVPVIRTAGSSSASRPGTSTTSMTGTTRSDGERSFLDESGVIQKDTKCPSRC